jgi:hypothetical protein
MPGLVPGIHVLGRYSKKDVDGRDKPGHDDELAQQARVRLAAPIPSPEIALSARCGLL